MPIIQSLDRALKMLDLFNEHHIELKITEIASRMEMHKSTVHSLLKTLQIHGYIDQNMDSGKYKLGLKLLERSQLLLQGLDIRSVARKHLEYLSQKTGQTTHLVILNGNEGVYIDKVEGEKAVIRYSRIGKRISIHSSGVGKVLIAFRKEKDEIESILNNYHFEQKTKHTIQDLGTFRAEISEVQMKGYAIDNQENEQGVRCAAVPVYNHNGEAIAAMSISTMVTHVDDEELKHLIELLKAEAKKISHSLGYREER
jgi:IclR family KDG regulon transcriptional repressor